MFIRKGFGRKARFTRRGLFVICFLFVFVLVVFFKYKTHIVLTARQFASDMMWSVHYVVALPIKTVKTLQGALAHYADRKEAYEKLLDENKHLRILENEYEALKVRTAQYEALLKLKPFPKYDFITARILADSGGALRRSLVIDVGKRDGVQVGNAVVGALGLVGRVVSVGRYSSRILLLTDPNSRIPVLIEPAVKNAILVGDNSQMPVLHFVERTADRGALDKAENVENVENSDIEGQRVVVSTAIGEDMPEGLLIGHIVGESVVGKSVLRKSLSEKSLPKKSPAEKSLPKKSPAEKSPTKKHSERFRVELAEDVSKLRFVKVLGYGSPMPSQKAEELPPILQSQKAQK